MQCLNRVICWTAAVMLMVAGPAAAQDEPPPSGDRTSGARTDWVSRENLTTEQAAALPSACCGRFIEPVRRDEHAETDPENAPTVIDAPSGFRQPAPGELQLNGPVELLKGYRSVTASGSATLREAEETVTLQGQVEFREPGLLLRGDSAFIDQAQEVTSLEQAGFLLYGPDIHGNASRIHYDGNTGYITVTNSALSRCEPGDEFWVLRSRDLEIDTEAGMAYARDVTLRIRDVPVFRYPYTLPFPITDARASGLLAPSVSTSRRGGLDVATPYYFNLAPHYDATVTPRIISRRGAMMEGEFRYLADWSMNTVNAAWMPDDALYDPALAGQFSDRSPPVNSRWFAGVEHEGLIGDRLRTMIDFNAVSDRDYFRDMGSSGLNLDNRSHLNREGSVQWFTRDWQSTARVQRIELIDPLVADRDINRPYDRMPEFTVQGGEELPGGLAFSLSSAVTRFDRELDPDRLSDGQIDHGALVSGDRTVIEPRLSRRWSTPGTFIEPALTYHYTHYDLDQQALGTDPDPERGVAQFSLDSGLIFERPVQLRGSDFRQTLEPRLYYLYSEYEEQQMLPTFDTTQRYLGFEQLFRRNRFGGHDRIGDANQISAAVTTRFLDDQGVERARAEIGQIFYFEDRQVSPDSPLQQWEIVQPLERNRSALVGRAGYSLSDDWSVRTDLQWSPQRQRFEEGAFSLRYQRDSDHIINIGYRYREKADFELDRTTRLDPQIRQTDISAVWPMNDNWRFIGRWNYDHSNKRNLESFAGVEYSNCCTTMRVVVRDWVNDYEFLDSQARPNRGIYFQFTLHGLGNVTGASISNLLSEGIPGFREYPAND